MTLASPDRWLWLLVAIPIVIFYLLKTRMRRRDVTTLLFWDQLFEEKRTRSLWRRLRHWLSLLLQLAFVALVGTAVMDPLWSGQENAARRVVIVLDNSAGMNAALDEDDANEDSDENESGSAATTRFEAAIEAARGIVAGLRDGDQAALVTAGGVVGVSVGMTDFPPAVRDALATVSPTDGPTRMQEAVQTARRLTESSAAAEVIVISDFAFPGAEELETAGDVRPIVVGAPAANVGITRMSVRRSLNDPIGYAVFLEIRNFSETPQQGRLTLELGNDLVDILPLELELGETWTHTITQTSTEGGVLAADLDIDDALATDNHAWAVLPRRNPVEVLLVSDAPSVYLQSVFDAIPLVRLQIAEQIPEAAPPGGLVVLHNLDTETLPSGSVLIIGPQASSSQFTLGDPRESALVAEQNGQSPLMAHIRLTNVALPGVRPISPPSDRDNGDASPAGWTSLIESAAGDTLMASQVADGDRRVILSAQLDSGDLPLRIAFPVLMTNAVNWFLQRDDQWKSAMQTGVPTRLRVAPSTGDSPSEDSVASAAGRPVARDGASASDRQAGADPRSWRWRDATGVTRAMAVEDGVATVGPILHAGVGQMLAPEQGGSDTAARSLAVNLADATESDLTPRIKDRGRDDASETSGLRSPWFYLTLAALALVVTEWALYQRRVVA